MSNDDDNTIESIDLRELHRVLGGMRQWAKGPDNSQLTLALQTVQQSIDSLKSQPNQSSSTMMMLPLMLMMRNRG